MTQNKPSDKDNTHGKNSIEAAADKTVGGIKAMKEQAQEYNKSPAKLPEARYPSLNFSFQDGKTVYKGNSWSITQQRKGGEGVVGQQHQDTCSPCPLAPFLPSNL
jgi:hypothetical protein